MSTRFWRRVASRSAAAAAAASIALGLACASAASAQVSAAPGVSGTVTSEDGAPVPNAAILFYGPGGDTTARADRAGRFRLALAPGLYAIRVDAPGYDVLKARTVGVSRAGETPLVLTLARSATGLVTIGRTQTSAGNTLSTSSVPSTIINAQTYADRGYTLMSDVLQNDISTTLVHPAGGGSSALPTSIALRGPDPTETLVDIDGIRVNNGNTGDFDLSLLDPAEFSSVELVKGISPSSLVGPDTIDGAINLQTLEPTATEHGLARFGIGSFNTFGETLQTTGTANRLGYAVSLHRTTSDGEVNETILDNTNGGAPATVGSALDASTEIAKLRYAFGRTGDGYAELSFRNQTQFRDLSAALTTVATPDGAAGDAAARRLQDDGSSTAPLLNGFEGTTLQAHNAAYGIDLRAPIGAPGADGVAPSSVLLRYYRSYVSQSVNGPGQDVSPYLYNDRDRIDDVSLELDREFRNSSLTFQYENHNESLVSDFVSGVVNDEAVARRAEQTIAARSFDAAADTGGPAQVGLGQTQRSAVLRYTYDPTAAVHLTAAAYYSRFSIFGTSIDPRFGAVYTPDPLTAIRISAGTTYQAPQLPELYVAPVLPVVVGQAISTGNPNLRPDRATEFGLGVERRLEAGSHQTTLSLDLYRVNLRQPATALAPNVDPSCGPVAAGGDGTPCPLTYSVNAGDAVYQGFEIQAERRLAPFTTLNAGFAARSAYLTAVPASVQDGTLVTNEQSLGLPLQKATLSLALAPPRGFTAYGSLVYEGRYNDLDQPPFATLAAGVGYRFAGVEVGLSGTNLTDAYDTRFTNPTGGVAYGIVGGTTSTPAYALQGPAVNLQITRRF